MSRGHAMKTVAFIPARSGSKGVADKNVKLICEKPLIAWSIEQAITSKLIDEVYVSTDCTRIAAISKSYGAKVPFLRPQSISGDYSTTESAIEHFCQFLEENKLSYENILLIQCTSPIRAIGRFDDAITNFKSSKVDSLISVSKSHRFLWKNFDQPIANYDFKHRPRRQDIGIQENTYIETGSFYLFKRSAFMKDKNRICGKYGLYLTPDEESFDIDTALDFAVCEALMHSSKDQANFVA